jgi:hypothetical protein
MQPTTMLWNTLKSLATGSSLTNKQKEEILPNLSNAISDSWKEFENIPQEEKDLMCVELAQDMGCKSSELSVCSKFIYDYAWSK